MKSFNEIDFSAVLEKYGNVLEPGKPLNLSERDLLEIWMSYVVRRTTEDFLKEENIRFVLECFVLDENGKICYTEQGEKMMIEAAMTEESYWFNQGSPEDYIKSESSK